nr:hypothetical protein [Tanacetum cinerariifolium]
MGRAGKVAVFRPGRCSPFWPAGIFSRPAARRWPSGLSGAGRQSFSIGPPGAAGGRGRPSRPGEQSSARHRRAA